MRSTAVGHQEFKNGLNDFDSSSHASHKRSTVRSLVNRAFKICSEEYLEDELQAIKKQLRANGYPVKLISKEINQCRQQITNSQDNQQNLANQKTYISTPYIRGTSERI